MNSVYFPEYGKWVIPMTCLILKVYSLANKKLKIITAGKKKSV